MMTQKWSEWKSFGTPDRTDINSRVDGLVVGQNLDGRLEVFLGAGRPMHIWQTQRGGDWSHWHPLGGGGIGTRHENLAVGRNQDGRLEVFTLSTPPGSDPNAATPEELWSIWQTTPNGGWSHWHSHGRPDREESISYLGFFEHRNTNRRIAVGSNQDGRLEAFAQHWGIAGRDERGDILAAHFWHIWQTAPNNGWSAWRNAGRPPQLQVGETSGRPFDFHVVNNQDGRLELFTAGTDFGPWQIWQTSPNNGWSDWRKTECEVLSRIDLAVGQNADGRLEMFVVDENMKVRHTWQTKPNNGWSEWASLGAPSEAEAFGVLSHLAVAQNGDGRLEVFVLAHNNGNQGDFWHIRQTAPNNGWSGWENLGSPPGSFGAGIHITHPASAIASNADGHLELFCSGRRGEVWHTRQV